MGQDIQKELLSNLMRLDQPEQEKVLQFTKQLLEEKEADFGDKLSEEQISLIKKGLEQIEKGETVSHEEVKMRYEKWLNYE
jgi:predicted transcriptional regulator